MVAPLARMAGRAFGGRTNFAPGHRAGVTLADAPGPYELGS
jgi:hypothetical protein